MNVPKEVTNQIDTVWPIFAEWVKSKGWASFPSGIDLVKLWYEFVYMFMKEVEEPHEIILEIPDGADD